MKVKVFCTLNQVVLSTVFIDTFFILIVCVCEFLIRDTTS